MRSTPLEFPYWEDRPLADRMNLFERGMLSQNDTEDMLQELLNSGKLWKLSEVYVRKAEQLIHLGLLYMDSLTPIPRRVRL